MGIGKFMGQWDSQNKAEEVTLSHVSFLLLLLFS
jgi:hypothetical protein